MFKDNIIEEWEKDEKRIIAEGIVREIIYNKIKFCIVGIILFTAGMIFGSVVI